MKYPHYCSHCHKIVLHPNVQEITYFLNERHPQEEDDCSYHGSTVQPSATAGQAGSSGRKQVYQNRTVSGAGSPASRKNPAAGNARRAKASKSRIRTVMIAFAAAYVLASVFSIIQTIVRKANEKESRTAEAYTEVREETEAASEEYSSYELSADEVREAGTACSQFGHLSATSQEVVRDFLPAVEREGCSVDSEGQTDYNFVYEADGVTSYQENYWFDISRYGETAQVQLSFDTATEEFHGMVVTGYDEDLMVLLAECAVTALKDAGAVDEDLDFRESFYGTWEQDWGSRGGYTQMSMLDVMYWAPQSGDGLENELYLFARGYMTQEGIAGE